MSRHAARPPASRLKGRGKTFGIAVSRFNERVTSILLRGALQTFANHGVAKHAVDVVHVPGAFELPMALQRMARRRKYDALVALGAVIRGETPHFHFVSSESARGIMDVSLSLKIPIAFGVLTTDTISQAMARAGGRRGNKGIDAALAALEMANLFR